MAYGKSITGNIIDNPSNYFGNPPHRMELGSLHSINGYQFSKGLMSVCSRCNRAAVWLGDRMLYPTVRAAPFPNADLPDEIKVDYEEASAILAASPRGAAALLRLCIQKLCKHLDEPGKNINSDIASLVKKGLPSTLQKAFDAVRVTGNEAVHPGEMDLRDDVDTATSLFALVNIISEKMISDPKRVEAIYAKLPENKLKQIEQRDGTPTALIEAPTTKESPDAES